MGDPGPKHLDQAPFYQPPPPVSSSAPSTTEGHLDPHDSNIDVQNHQPSGQEPKDRRAALERAFAACNLYPTAEHHRSAASNSGLFVPKRSRSPEKEDAPPFQYRAPRRPAGYHLSSSRPAPSSNPPIAASFSQEAESSGHYVQSLSQGKSSPLCLTQGAFIQSFNHRGPPLACPPRSPIVEQFSQAELSRLNSTKGPFVEPFEKSPPLSVTQRSTAKPLLFDPTESFAESYRSPQLVPPHRPGGYNPILNPYIPKPKSSSSQPSKKPGFWGRAKRKFSGRRVSSHQSTRPTTPVGRSPPHSPVTTPFSRPSPPTPNRERSISQAKVHLSGQNYDETLVRKGSEAASPLNQVAGTKTPFFVADKGKAILQTNPAGDWEAEALREREVRSKRIFGHPDSIFGAFGVYTQLRSQYLSNLQDSPEISAPEPNKPRESVDSSETLAPQPERPGRSQYSAETVTSQLQNPRTSQDSATTLVPQPEDTRIYRDPEDRYYSLIVTHKNRPQVVGGREETNEWVEILASTFEKLESSPVPSYLFEDYCDVGGNQTARSQISDSPQEQDPPRSLGEVNPIETPRARVHRRLSERGIVNAICRSLPDGQLAPSTPKGSGRSQTYFALTGGSPTNSLCLEWEKENPDSSVREEVGRHFHPKLEDQVDDLRSVYAAGRVEEHSPTRGRGQLHEGQGFPSEESSTAAKRRAAADRRRRLKGYPVRDREGPGEGIIDRFIDSQRRFDRPKSLRSNAAPGEEVGELVPKRILSAAKQGVERRRRLADALDEVAASANESSLDKALATTNPLENYNHSDHAGKVDEDLVPSSDSAREIPKESVKRLTDTLQQYSSEVRSRSSSLLYHTM